MVEGTPTTSNMVHIYFGFLSCGFLIVTKMFKRPENPPKILFFKCDVTSHAVSQLVRID